MRSRTTIATLALAAACLLTSVGTATGQTPRVCQWGGTQPNPTGQFTIKRGLTMFPSPFALPFKAWGPLSGGAGCQGTMTFVGQLDAGSSCNHVTGFEGRVEGLPGVKYFWGPAFSVFIHEFLYDAQGNVVGSDHPIAFPPDSNDPAYHDCFTSKGLTHNHFSSTVELYGQAIRGASSRSAWQRRIRRLSGFPPVR
jgi:hypothetical protein